MSIKLTEECAEQSMRDQGYTKLPSGCWYKQLQGWTQSMSPLPRPPLGVMPRTIWLEHRIKELSEAITRQFAQEGHTPDLCLIDQWSQEINDLNGQVKHARDRMAKG